MSKEIDVLVEGFHAARTGVWPGRNPYPLEPERTWWLDGFRCWRPANDATAPPGCGLPLAPANDTELPALICAGA